uniref:Helicase ATP-binding domain-containing protein n=1 Tax=viral metagenome TaxID=1070528 RepID=A0A6C0JBH4_9ZZZZ
MTDTFVPYPDIHDERFYEILYNKKEFNKTAYKTSYRYSKTEDICTKGEFKMQNHQEFIRNFISPETPYNGIILFHGTGVGKTCAAIGTTEGLRDYVKASGKIYIIAPETIRPNFIKEMYDPGKDAIEKERHGLPGSYQCAGDSYYVKGSGTGYNAAKKLIDKYYGFYGPGEFANFVDLGLGGALPPNKSAKFSNDDGSSIDIGDYFSNSVIVIDEAHGIAGEDKKTYKQKKPKTEEDEDEDDQSSYIEQEMDLEDNELIVGKKSKPATSKRSLLKVLIDTIIPLCHKKGHKLKIILLTATPMKDNVRELADLLELLNANDGTLPKIAREAWRSSLFPKNMTMEDLLDKERVDKIKSLARGYISYVKGNNPITFPQAMLPNADVLYEPARFSDGSWKPMYAYRSNSEELEDISQDEYEIYLPNSELFRFELVKCSMSLYQFKCYISQIYKRNIKAKKVKQKLDTGDIGTRMVSNFSFPFLDGTTHTTDTFIKGTPIPNIKLTYGKTGFEGALTESFKIVGNNHKIPIFAIKHTIYKKYGNFLSQNNGMYSLEFFSKKFDMFLDYVTGNNGIAYAYSEFVEGGALIAALVLEANGFVRYSPGLSNYLTKEGLPVENIYEKYPQAHMFISEISDRKPISEHYRCALCGNIYNECREADAKVNLADKHEFKISTYIIVAGNYGGVLDIAEATSDNIFGQKVKVILGTRKTSQGVDLKWVRQIHILDPWHNNTRIYQAIGRGLRHCSHADLPESMRNVTIYKYSSVPNDEGIIEQSEMPTLLEKMNEDIIIDKNNIGLKYRDYFTETVDEHMYRRVVRKDMVIKALERILKESAVDCELNRMRNYFPDHDKDYTRECDYMPCKYDCTGFLTPIKYIRRIRKYRDGLLKDLWYIVDDENIEVQKDNLTHIPQIMEKIIVPDTDDVTIINTVTTNQQVWDNLKQRHKIDTGETDQGIYDDLMVDIPLITVDDSTYNIYFSLPQISNSIKIITRIYQNYEALKLNKIIYLVNQSDPNLEKPYIYMALNKMIGRPPKVPPIILIDKYGRKGHIMYYNGFYLYQPNEIYDTRIPMQYRRKPLDYKRMYYNMDVLVPKEVVKVIEKVTTINKDKLSKAITLLRKTRVESSISFIYYLYITLNNYTPSEHRIIIETVISSIFSSELKDIALVDIYIFEYYLRTGLMLFDNWDHKSKSDIVDIILDMKKNNEGGIIHMLATENIRKFVYGASNKWEWRNMDDDNLDYYKSATKYDTVIQLKCPSAHGINGTKRNLLYICPELNTNILTGGCYSFISNAAPRNHRPLIRNGAEYIALLKKSVRSLQDTYKTPEQMKLLKFKVVDQYNAKASKETASRNKSKRNALRGMACSSNEVETNEIILKRLIIILMESFEKYISPYETISREYFEKIFELVKVKSNKLYVCKKIEHVCILLDYYQVNNVKWYLTILETELYRPKK